MKSIIVVLCLIFLTIHTFSQQTSNDSLLTIIDSTESDWSFAADGYYYLFPDDKNTGTLIGYADYKEWHMEARYNYEDEKTGSVFGGYRFETGKNLIFGITPIAGIVFGTTNGIAPGIELDITWKKFDFYSESEYVFDFEKNENNFYYTWSELAITPFESFRTGISVQKTKLFKTDLDLQRGAFAQYSFWKLTATAYYFNPVSSNYFLIAGLGIQF